MDIEANLNAYLGARSPTARYASFDYCFNHFPEPSRAGQPFGHHERLQIGALLPSLGLLPCQLGNAAWVLSPSSQKCEALRPVIEVIAAAKPEIWAIDADRYDDEASLAMLELARQIRAALPEGASDILVTKIMLGVFGCVPAFDTYFKRGFGISVFGRKALRQIADFYDANSETIESHRVAPLDFATGEKTNREYTRAKVIDMIFFVEGGL